MHIQAEQCLLKSVFSVGSDMTLVCPKQITLAVLYSLLTKVKAYMMNVSVFHACVCEGEKVG